MDVNNKAQAMVMDALFLLMIAGFASASLLWASNIYGNKSFEAYKYMYLNDYETSALAVLSALEYNDAGVARYWLDELGRFMKGEFNETHNRYTLFVNHWQMLCEQSPAPMLLTVCSGSEGVIKGKCDKNTYQPIFLGCGRLLDSTWKDDDGRNLSLNESQQQADTTVYVVNQYKYPYYSSPIESKPCNIFRCEMEIKIYY